MDENLRNILNEIESAIRDIDDIYARGPIYNSANSRNSLGREAIYSREIQNGIRLRLVNDASFSIGGDATPEAKRELMTSLEQLTNSDEVAQETKDTIYNIIDAIQRSIDEPERDQRITDAEPVAEPTAEPTATPTTEPIVTPTAEPTVEPTATPTVEPTVEPTATPTVEPTVEPTAEPISEIEQLINEDLDLLNEAIATFTRIREIYITATDNESKKENKDTYIAETISIKFILDDLENVRNLIVKEKDKIIKSNKIPSKYNKALFIVLDETLSEYDDKVDKKVLKKNGFSRKEYDEAENLMDRINDRNNELDKKANRNDLLIRYDDKSGKYVLSENGRELYYISANKTFDMFSRPIWGRIAEENEELDCSERLIKRRVDPAIYMLLSEYDKKAKTHYAKDFVKAVIDGDKKYMPAVLEYKIGKRENISLYAHSNVSKYAKMYKKYEIAGVEMEDGILSKAFSSARAFFIGIPERFNRLKNKILGKGEDIKKLNGKNDETSRTDNGDKPKSLVEIKYKNGEYTLTSYGDVKKGIRFGDKVIVGIQEAATDSGYIKNIKEKFKLTDEELTKIDPTVYAALVHLSEIDRSYKNLPLAYIKATINGQTVKGLSLNYDLSSIEAIETELLSEEGKSKIKGYAKIAENLGYGIVKEPLTDYSAEYAERINRELRNSREGLTTLDGYALSYDKIYRKSDIEMNKRLIKLLKGLEDPTLLENENKAIINNAILRMAKDRGIAIVDEKGKKISIKKLYQRIVILESDNLEKDSGYLVPEEKKGFGSKTKETATSKKKAERQEEK